MSHDDGVDSGISNRLIMLWTGGYSLAVSFWVWGVAGEWAWSVLMSIVGPGLVRQGRIVVPVLLVLTAVAYHVVVFVGVWRSAGRYAGPAIWARSARVVVAVAAVWLFARLVVALIVVMS